MLQQAGFIDIEIGPRVDTFGGAVGEDKARAYEVYGYAFRATKPN
jgi:arsenite methyltransferase